MSSSSSEQPTSNSPRYGETYTSKKSLPPVSESNLSAIPTFTSESTVGTMQSDIDVMAQLASHYYSFGRNRSRSAPIPPANVSTTWQFSEVESSDSHPSIPPAPIMTPIDLNGDTSQLGGLGTGLNMGIDHLQLNEPENEPMDGGEKSPTASGPLPATFLRTICDQIEYYFCDENLLGDLFLLKNMNMEGYVKLDLLASFGRVKKLTTELDQIRRALELSTKLVMNEEQTMVCRKDPLPADQTYHGKLARTAIAYNLPEEASIASLREIFSQCGEITYLRLLKKNSTTGRNAVLKPPIVAGETYAIIEFVDDEMAKHAVLTLSDSYNTVTGIQVVLFDGTNSERLKQKMFPMDVDGDRRRAKSTSAVARQVHVDSVGEGLDDLREGKVSTGTVFSIRGAGGLITPTRHETACISFRLIPDEDGNMDIRPGDYVSFTVGKNKKSGRKYASKVKLEFRPPASLTADLNPPSSSPTQKEYFSGSNGRWESRNRSATVGAPVMQPSAFRGRSASSGTRPKLNLSPRSSTSPTSSNVTPEKLPTASNGSSPSYRQALGPDGTRGFGQRRNQDPEMPVAPKFSPLYERRRAHSSAAIQ